MIDLKNIYNSKLQNDLFLKRTFLILAFIIFCIMMAMTKDTAINGDEYWQIPQAERILKFYTTFGQDRSVYEDVPGKVPYYYGKCFEFVNAVVAKITGVEINGTGFFWHQRHILIAIFGFLALFFTGLLGKELKGWWTAIIALLFIFLSPRFFGHALMNSKDIPYATGNIIALYFLIRYIKRLPKPDIKSKIGFIAGVAIAFSMRPAGVLLIIYFVLANLFWYAYHHWKNKEEATKMLPQIIIQGSIVAILSYFAGLLFWPYGLLDPIYHPYEAITQLTHFPTNIRMLFNGEHVFSNEVPGYYVSKWIYISTPIVVLIGLAFFIISSLRKQPYTYLFLIVLFTAVFPLVYIIIKEAHFYDGWRHTLFIYPSIVALAALGWSNIVGQLKSKYLQFAFIALLIFLLINPIAWTVRSYPHHYAYFNQIAGGIKKAYGKYETDYYLLSMKKAAKWLIENEKIYEQDKKILIVSNSIYPAKIYIKNENVKVQYARYDDRGEKDWDYAIFVSRFVYKGHLKRKYWPPKGTIHTIKADGIPLCAILKRENRYDFLAEQAVKSKDYVSAINYFTKAVQYNPKDETLHMGLGVAYMSIGSFDKAIAHIGKAVQIHPENANAYYLLGVAYMRAQKYNQAILACDKAVGIFPNFSPAYIIMGSAYAQKGALDEAILALNNAITAQPNNKQAYSMLGNIYLQKGDKATAQKCFDAVKQLSKQK